MRRIVEGFIGPETWIRTRGFTDLQSVAIDRSAISGRCTKNRTKRFCKTLTKTGENCQEKAVLNKKLQDFISEAADSNLLEFEAEC